MQLMSLAELLVSAEALDWSHEVYMPMNEMWTEETICLVLEPEENEIPENSIEYIKQHNLKCIFGIDIVQDIVINSKLQDNGNEIDVHRLFQAFVYYYENDAFIQFT